MAAVLPKQVAAASRALWFGTSYYFADFRLVDSLSANENADLENFLTLIFLGP